MDANSIQEHVTGTYRSLRSGLAWISLLFAPFLWIIGFFWHGVPVQSSMSDYYYAESNGPGPIHQLLSRVDMFRFLDQFDSQTPMRSWFVGTLFALGIFLYLYKGFSRGENWLLNGAGLFGLGVALFPTGWDCSAMACPPVTLHGFFAISAFLCLALVALLCTEQTLGLPGLSERRRQIYRILYRVAGVFMIVSPLVAFAANYVAGVLFRSMDVFVFLAEMFGLVAFSFYWFIKSRELDENQAENRALRENLQTSPEPVIKGQPSLSSALGLRKLQDTN